MRSAEGDHLADAFNGKACAERAGLVVEAAVQHSAVVAGLVTAGAGFLFKQKKIRSGKALKKPVGRGETNDPSADDGNFSAHLFGSRRDGDHCTGASEDRAAYLSPRKLAVRYRRASSSSATGVPAAARAVSGFCLRSSLKAR